MCERSHSKCQVCCTCEDCKKCNWGSGFADCCKKCFPSTATVTLENGKQVEMSELKTGDKVQTGKTTLYLKMCLSVCPESE